jgi:serine protease Do
MDVISDAPGSKVTLEVIRNGQPTTVTVTLGQRPSGVEWDKRSNGGSNSPDNDDNDDGGNASVRGISVENLTPDLAQQIGATSLTHGVVVDNVDADSPAADNIARGMVITAVDRHPVANVQDFKRLMSQAQGKPVLITFSFNGQTGFTVVQPSNK